MAEKLLESSAISAFCGSITTMLSAGVQLDEAVHMLAENRESSYFKSVCDQVYLKLISGSSLAESMDETGAFPAYAVNMVRIGEASGRTDRVLRSLDHYYDSEGRMFAKLRSVVGYPAALLCIMSVILAFTVAFILPTFIDVYNDMTGSLTTSSYNSVNASIIIGWIALVLVLIATIVALVIAGQSRTERGREWVLHVLEKLPITHDAMYQLALSRFTNALAAYVASGVLEEIAMEEAMKTVDHAELYAKLQRACEDMNNLENPRSLAQAISENEIFEPLYSRMLLVGTRAGSADAVLSQLSDIFFEDATVKIDGVVDSVEPVLAVFLTIAVGATLIAVMLPLVGIMGSIG